MASDAIQKRASNPGLDEDADGKTGVLKIFGKIGGSKSNRKVGADAIVSPTGASTASTSNSTTSSQQTSAQGIRNSTSVTKQPLSAREDSRRAVPGLALPTTSTGATGSLSDNGDASPGRAMAPKKGMDSSDKSLNASTTSLALRKLFLGKPESLTMDDFALWKQFREMEPDFSLEVNATSPYPFLKVAVRCRNDSCLFHPHMRPALGIFDPIDPFLNAHLRFRMMYLFSSCLSWRETRYFTTFPSLVHLLRFKVPMQSKWLFCIMKILFTCPVLVFSHYIAIPPLAGLKPPILTLPDLRPTL
jgi:hypothetical protein